MNKLGNFPNCNHWNGVDDEVRRLWNGSPSQERRKGFSREVKAEFSTYISGRKGYRIELQYMCSFRLLIKDGTYLFPDPCLSKFRS